MDKYDKGKLKVLIKNILLYEYPRFLSSNQLAKIINQHDYAFRSNVTSAKIGKLLGEELMKHDNNMMDCIVCQNKGNYRYYGVSNDYI